MEFNVKHFFPSSVIAPTILVGGLLIVTFGLAGAMPEFPNRIKMLDEPVVDSPRSGEQPGCAAMQGKQLKSTNANVANVLFSISLGHLADGRGAEINLRESKITADTYSPDVLGFSMPSEKNGAELIVDDSRPSRMIGDGATYLPYKSEPLRQVRVPDTLVDIVVISKWEYELRFYRPAYIGAKREKLYELLGEPYVVYRFRNPNAPSANRLEITKIKDGTEDKSTYFYDAELELWSLTRNGVEVSRKQSAVNPDDPCERIETRFDTEGSKLIKAVKIYKGFPWGQSIIKIIEDPDGEARTTSYKYFEDRNVPHYSFIKSTIHPHGEVEFHNLQPDLTMPSPRKP
jgi:hypothetical protein